MPPTSMLDGPPMPPQSEERLGSHALRIIAIVQRVWHGDRCPITITTLFQLAPGEYDEIERRLRRLGCEDALGAIRYDYNARTYLFVMVRPSARHEIFLSQFHNAITEQLSAIAQGSDKAAAFARDIFTARSTKNEHPEPGLSAASVHSPDDQYFHLKERRPGVVIEVADSQPWKELKEMAGSYLYAGVHAVVGVDFDYGPRATRRATLSVWRLQIDDAAKTFRVVGAPKREAFRDKHGNPTDSPGMRLRLSDFASKQLSQELLGDDDHDIVVSTDRLCCMLDIAEERDAQIEESLAQGSGDADWLSGYTKVHSESSSSPDPPTSSDEAEEQRDLDDDWHLPEMHADAADPERDLPVLRSRRAG